MLLGTSFTTRKYLDWCFKYLLKRIDHTQNYQWLDGIDFNHVTTLGYLQNFFNEQGYQLSQIKIDNDLKTPAIICFNSTSYAVLLEFSDDIIWIEHPEKGGIQIKPHSGSYFLLHDLIYLEKLVLLLKKENLTQQILFFALKKIFSKWYVGCFIFSSLVIYELFSLIEPILLNVVIEHLDLFGSFVELILPLLSIAFIILCGVGIGYYRQRFWLLVFGNCALGLSQDLMKQFFRQNLNQQNNLQAHDHFGRLYAVEQVLYRTLQHLFFTVMDIVFLMINLVIMCNVNLKLASVDLLFFVSLIFLNYRYNKLYYLDSSRLLGLQSDSSQILLDGLEHLKLIKKDRLENIFSNRWQLSKNKYWDAFLQNDWLQHYFDWALLAFRKINWIVMLSLGVYLILKKQLSLGAFVGFLALKNLVFSRFELGLKRILQWQYLKAPLDRVAEIFLNKHYERSQEYLGPANLKIPGIVVSDLMIRDLKFRNRVFEPNKKYLIKGMSGCGKSSLLNTICGVSCLDSGRIYYDGQACDVDEWQIFHRECVYVEQGESLFKASLLDNICLFAPDINHAHLEDIIELLELQSIFDNLAHGIYTHIDEIGINLSGGQLQRIYLARALYKKPKWLILDEATCHLDENSEKKLIEKLAALPLSMIVVNHRHGYELYFDEVIEWDSLVHVSTK